MKKQNELEARGGGWIRGAMHRVSLELLLALTLRLLAFNALLFY